MDRGTNRAQWEGEGGRGCEGRGGVEGGGQCYATCLVRTSILLRSDSPPPSLGPLVEWSTKHPLFSLEISGNAKCWGPSVFLFVFRKTLYRPSCARAKTDNALETTAGFAETGALRAQQLVGVARGYGGSAKSLKIPGRTMREGWVLGRGVIIASLRGRR